MTGFSFLAAQSWCKYVQFTQETREQQTGNEKSSAAWKPYQWDLILVCSEDYKEEIHPALHQRERLCAQSKEQN